MRKHLVSKYIDVESILKFFFWKNIWFSSFFCNLNKFVRGRTFGWEPNRTEPNCSAELQEKVRPNWTFVWTLQKTNRKWTFLGPILAQFLPSLNWPILVRFCSVIRLIWGFNGWGIYLWHFWITLGTFCIRIRAQNGSILAQFLPRLNWPILVLFTSNLRQIRGNQWRWVRFWHLFSTTTMYCVVSVVSEMYSGLASVQLKV